MNEQCNYNNAIINCARYFCMQHLTNGQINDMPICLLTVTGITFIIRYNVVICNTTTYRVTHKIAIPGRLTKLRFYMFGRLDKIAFKLVNIFVNVLFSRAWIWIKFYTMLNVLIFRLITFWFVLIVTWLVELNRISWTREFRFSNYLLNLKV